MTTRIAARVLNEGDVLIGETGAHVRITGTVEPSHTMTGCVAVETEVGTLYLDTDEEVPAIRADDYNGVETWLTLIEHEHGIDWALSDTESEAFAIVDRFVGDWWDTEKNDGIGPGEDGFLPLPEDPTEARDAYFDGHDTESYLVQSRPGR